MQVEGEIRTREYTPARSGETKKSITEVRVTSVTKLDRPQKTEDAA